MNENLDLVEILKDCSQGTKLYLATIGCEVQLKWVKRIDRWPIRVTTNDERMYDLTRRGSLDEDYPNGECMLFPSKDQRDWSKFKVAIERFDYSTLSPMTPMLVRRNDSDQWVPGMYYLSLDDTLHVATTRNQGIPFNDETKHLAGTTDMPSEKYIWWSND